MSNHKCRPKIPLRKGRFTNKSLVKSSPCTAQAAILFVLIACSLELELAMPLHLSATLAIDSSFVGAPSFRRTQCIGDFVEGVLHGEGNEVQ